MRKSFISYKLVLYLFCLCLLIPNNFSIICENNTSIQLNTLDSPIDEEPIFNPLIDYPTLNSPSNGERINDNTPLLEWFSVSGASFYNYQVDNNADFSSLEQSGSIRNNQVTLAHLSDRRYYWRVQASTSHGEQSSWSSSWSFIVDTTPPDAPNLNRPFNGVTINDDNPYFYWYAVSGNLYNIQVDNDANFVSPTINHYTAFTSFASTSLMDTTYYWHVRARDAAGNWGSWSSIYSFTVDAAAPDKATLISPASGALMSNPTPYLDWLPVSSAYRYIVLVDNNPSCQSAEIVVTTTDTAITCPTLADGVYYWRVTTIDGGGSSLSFIRSFTIDTTPPSEPDLSSPTNGLFLNDQTPSLDWRDLNTATQYRVQLDNNEDFSSPIVNSYIISSDYTCPILSENRYYWRVCARDAVGNWGSWSSSRYFTIDFSNSDKPILISPSNGSIISRRSPYLEWYAVSSAVVYQIQIDDNIVFSSPTIDTSTRTNLIGPRIIEDTYYWRVRARDAASNWSPWSDVWCFTNDVTAPEKPTLLSPGNGTILNDSTSTLDWLSVPTAIFYDILFDSDKDFSSPELFTTADTSYTLTNLADGIYYWSVRAGDVAGNMDEWSDVWAFKIDTVAPTITNVENEPTTPTDAESVTISCDVADQNGIDLVTLHYRINGGAWVDATMVYISGSTYQVNLGAFAYDDLIEYYITSFDPAYNLAKNDNNGTFYRFVITSNDHIEPTISLVTHTPIKPISTETITISCSVIDTTGIQKVFLFYRINHGSWINIRMSSNTDNIYNANIGAFTNNSVIEYYVTATDSSPQQNIATDNNNGAYYSFTVDASLVSTTNQISLMLLIPFIVAVLSTIIIRMRKKR